MTLEEIEEEFEKWLTHRFTHPYNLYRTDSKEILKECWIASRKELGAEIKRLRAAIEKHRGDMMWGHFHRNQELYKALEEVRRDDTRRD